MEIFSKNAYIKTMIEDKNEQRKQLLLSKIAQFRLFDDDFMSKVFEDDIEATEFLLKIILQRDDLEVTESKGQVSIKNLLGRSVRLDIKAKDKTGKLYNIEVQRADSGAGEKRARYYSAILDANSLLPRQDFDKLPETYVVFITEHDVLKGGLPLYHINRKIEENGMTFCDESHIIYVNGEYKEDNDIGKLMHDFSCENPDDMKLRLLAEKTRYFKKDEKGVKRMCKIMEDFAAEERNEEREEIAIGLLEIGKMTYAEIAAVSKLSEEKVKELAEKVKVVV
ncbi:MAG: PD-(D/E)XK nuclease family transposase [Treponema sp.]|nr:PD-(D/E)XK nuclease family transposase [Treponema sp.]